MATASGIKAGEAYVRVFSDDSDLRRGLKGLHSQVEGFGKGLANVGAGVAGIGASMASIGGVGLAALAWPLQLASNMENTEASFTTLLKDVDAAKALMGELKQFAASTPFQFDELADAGKKLLAFGSAAGDVQTELRRIGDISSAIGAPIGEIAEIYGKARVQGRLFAEDINQLTGRGIPIIQELAKQFNVAETQIAEMVKDGQVNFGNLEKAFISLTGAGGKFAGGMERQSKTLSGSFSTLKDNIVAAFQPFGEVLLPIAKTALGVAGKIVATFAKWADANRELVIPLGIALVGVTAIGAAATVAGVALMGIGSVIAGIVPAALALAPVLGPVAGVVGSVLAVSAALALAVVEIGAGFAYVANEAGLLAPAFDYIKNAFSQVFATFNKTFGGMVSALGSGQFGLAAQIAWAGVKVATLQGTQSVLRGIEFLWKNAGALTVAFFQGLGRVVYKVFAAIPKIALSALRGGAALATALQSALAGAFEGADLASGLDPAIAAAQAKLDALVLRAAPQIEASAGAAAVASDPQFSAAFQSAAFAPPPMMAAAPAMAPAPTYTTTGGMGLGGFDPIEEQRRHFAYLTGDLETSTPGAAAAVQSVAERQTPTGGGGFDLDQLITTAQEQLFVLRRIEQAGLQ